MVPQKPVPIESSTADFERAVASGANAHYVLRLYVTGMTARSMDAIANIRALCDEHLKDRYELECIDIYKHPHLAAGEQIVATPTLIKKLPAPLRRMVGDLSNKEQVLFGLDLRASSTK